MENFIVTTESVAIFADVSGDKNPIHLDPTYAAGTRFKRPIVHGALISSYFSAILGNILPGQGSIIMELNFKFLKPVFVGAEIKLEVVVTDIRADKPIIKLAMKCYSPDSELVVDGLSTIYLGG